MRLPPLTTRSFDTRSEGSLMSSRDDANLPTGPETEPTDATNPTGVDRRAALRRLGTLAAWTAPTLVVLTTSARADDFGSPSRPEDIVTEGNRPVSDTRKKDEREQAVPSQVDSASEANRRARDRYE